MDEWTMDGRDPLSVKATVYEAAPLECDTSETVQFHLAPYSHFN